MPILKSAKKALRASARKAVHNQAVRSRVKSALDAVRKNPVMETLTEAYSALDVAVKKNLIHANKAARVKSQVAKLVKPTKLAKAVKKAVKPAKKAVKKTAAKAVKKVVSKKPKAKK